MFEPSLSPAPVAVVELEGVVDVVEPEHCQHWAYIS